MKSILIFAAATMVATLTSIKNLSAFNIDEDCDCTAPAYVNYLLLSEFELDDVPWEVVSIEASKQGGVEQCYVTIIASSRRYDNGPYVPDGEFAIHDTYTWNLASDFEAQLEETGCKLVPNS